MDVNTKDCAGLFPDKVYTDVRLKALRYIYLPNRKKYPLAFQEYEVIFKDGWSGNTNSWNLELVKIN